MLDNRLTEHYRLLEDGQLIKPVNVVNVRELNNYDLFKYLESLSNARNDSEHDYNLWKVAYDEAVKRKLIPIIGSEEAVESEDSDE